MAAVAHSPSFAKKVGVPQSVGKDFSAADKGRKFIKGGNVKHKVKKYSGTDGSAVEADDMDTRRAARAARVAAYNATPKAQAAKRRAEELFDRLTSPTRAKAKDPSANETQLPDDIAAEAIRMKRMAAKEKAKKTQDSDPIAEAGEQNFRYDPETEIIAAKAKREALGYKKGGGVKKPGKTGQRARLAQTLKGFSNGGVSRGSGCESKGKTKGKFV